MIPLRRARLRASPLRAACARAAGGGLAGGRPARLRRAQPSGPRRRRGAAGGRRPARAGRVLAGPPARPRRRARAPWRAGAARGPARPAGTAGLPPASPAAPGARRRRAASRRCRGRGAGGRRARRHRGGRCPGRRRRAFRWGERHQFDHRGRRQRLQLRAQIEDLAGPRLDLGHRRARARLLEELRFLEQRDEPARAAALAAQHDLADRLLAARRRLELELQQPGVVGEQPGSGPRSAARAGGKPNFRASAKL